MTNSRKFTQGAVLLFGCGAAVLALSSCSLLKRTKGMANNTETMKQEVQKTNQTTEKMVGQVEKTNETTEEMKKSVEATKKTSETLLVQNRAAVAKKLRDDSIALMEDADEMAKKLEHGTAYNKGWEYQNWVPAFEDEDKLDLLLEEGVKELFKTTSGFTNDHSNFNVTSEKSDMQNLSAIAATLHYTASTQIKLLKEAGKCRNSACSGNLLSMLDVIQAGFAKKAALERGEISASDLKPWEVEIIRKEPEVVYLLKIRYNFLLAYSYVLTSSDKNGNEIPKFKNLLRVLGVSNWTPKLDDLNTLQIEYIASVMDYAQATRDYLSSVGYPVNGSIDKKVIKLWKHAKWGSVETLSGAGEQQKARAAQRVKAAYDRLALDF